MSLFFLCIFALTNSFKISKDVKSLVDDYFLPDDSVKAKLVDRSWKIAYKNLMPLDTDFVSGEKTIAIEEHSQNPWGVTVDFFQTGFPTPFEIDEVDPERQFANLGIRVGWEITKINDVELTETNTKDFKDLMKRGDACTLTFKSNDSSFALLQHQKSKELVLKSLSKKDAYEEYVTHIQIYLEQKQWRQAFAPWHFLPHYRHDKEFHYRCAMVFHYRYGMKFPMTLHKILQYNLVDLIDVNGRICRDNPETPLAYAILDQDAVLVEKLISRGAEVNVDTMMIAVDGGSVECTQPLLNANPELVNARDQYDDTPLFNALLYECNIEYVSLLLKYGANLETRDSNGRTALEVTKLSRRKKEFVKILKLAELVQKSFKKECLQKFKQYN